MNARYLGHRTWIVVAAAAVGGSLAHSVLLRRRLDRARRDPLTGAWSRQAWTARASRALAGRTLVLVVLVDLDGFKAINDAHGHAAGDAVLQAVVTRLERWSPAGGRDRVGRLGGDEFVAVLPAGDADRLEDLHQALCAPVWWDGRQLPIGASLGAYLAAAGTTVAGALAAADAAMYTAKFARCGVCLSAGDGASQLVPAGGRWRRHRPAVRVPRPRRAVA
jgi:diguanylate cyclase (GGDEF)-like protein